MLKKYNGVLYITKIFYEYILLLCMLSCIYYKKICFFFLKKENRLDNRIFIYLISTLSTIITDFVKLLALSLSCMWRNLIKFDGMW